MSRRPFHAIGGTVEKVVDELLGIRPRRTWWCTTCEHYHVEGLDARFREHYNGEHIGTVPSTQIADYREQEHQRRTAGG